ncbi:hypothetical protein [Streptomyces sp. NPDC008137]|uniref:hypothetical protein n=1 Tax=Streptomyces sp. NPDC008137 TaxID=3364813 RepID=UPI0036DFD0DF
MSFEGFPVGGWRTRTVPVHRAAGSPAVLVVRSRGPLTSFVITPVIDTPRVKRTGGYLLRTWGTAPHAFVLPGEYTHVEVERAGRESNGFARWSLDRIAVDELRPLRGRVIGTGSQVFIWRGSEGRFRFDFTDKYSRNSFGFFSFDDGREDRLESDGDTRGTATIPGPGFVRIQSPGTWTANVVDQPG